MHVCMCVCVCTFKYIILGHMLRVAKHFPPGQIEPPEDVSVLDPIPLRELASVYQLPVKYVRDGDGMV